MKFNFKEKSSTINHHRLHAPTLNYFRNDHIGTGLDLIRE